MTKPILEIENISKMYTINGRREDYLSFRDSFKNSLRRSPREDFWALKDINFKVNTGDSLGIIGKNGAGKSTLLKVLSRITPPTTGKIISRGRIASLLEVGTGFHGELTGRENIFMNGSILGMKRTEIQKNFDAIVDFSGVEKFLDTPLKHYSSGMQLRLAFAVAAFLENEILIIDEVLAVGDAEFQNKCMGKMDEVSKSGRTVIFVSHNMGSVSQLCSRFLVMNSGELALDTESMSDAFNLYNSNTKKDDKLFLENKFIKELNYSIFDKKNNSKTIFTNEEEININFDIKYSIDIEQNATFLMTIKNFLGQPIFSDEIVTSNSLKYLIPANFLIQGRYTCSIRIHSKPTLEFLVLENLFNFEIQDVSSPFIIYNNYNFDYGKVFSKGKWID